ncbi:hypothetical protein [Pseudomonas fontis]|uniref:Uncharacterized protein n=1 Tax=Pseudomonas fontis TaxID=2942633 RepID=A0ABT5NNU6_9PSED|nr:hypothetical protein [Pseudomonas fontis]MDD0973063.1 hypothetical protein [Pseudomonas fontis]MDD0989832.1 hypothetical protein [Pseudomonas fontis]
MTLITVPDLTDLSKLLDTHPRQTPGLLLLGSRAWQYCAELHSQIATLANSRPDVQLYEFNVDDYEEDFLHSALLEIFALRHIKYLPSQVLLPSHGESRVISTSSLEEIRLELADMH